MNSKWTHRRKLWGRPGHALPLIDKCSCIYQFLPHSPKFVFTSVFLTSLCGASEWTFVLLGLAFTDAHLFCLRLQVDFSLLSLLNKSLYLCANCKVFGMISFNMTLEYLSYNHF